ncbi:hypothetical protein [Dokdonia sp.]|uniref:hypothetical protein n=1 Tax=Dokdonia sp. TaxID=2024995 RepID=UPI003262DEB1
MTTKRFTILKQSTKGKEEQEVLKYGGKREVHGILEIKDKSTDVDVKKSLEKNCKDKTLNSLYIVKHCGGNLKLTRKWIL